MAEVYEGRLSTPFYQSRTRFNEDTDERSTAINTPLTQKFWKGAVWREAFRCCQTCKALCFCGRGDNLFYGAEVLAKEGQQTEMAGPSGQVQQKLCKLIIFPLKLEQLIQCLINYWWHKGFGRLQMTKWKYKITINTIWSSSQAQENWVQSPEILLCIG